MEKWLVRCLLAAFAAIMAVVHQPMVVLAFGFDQGVDVKPILAQAVAMGRGKPAVLAADAPVPNPDLLDRLFKTDDEIVRVQTLLGYYVIGKTNSGPVLISNPVEIAIGAEYRDILNQFPFLRAVAVDGRFRVLLGANVAAEYGRIRAEFMARLPRLILLEKATGIGNDLSRGHIIWARGLQIISQPECVGTVGRNPWPGYCS